MWFVEHFVSLTSSILFCIFFTLILSFRWLHSTFNFHFHFRFFPFFIVHLSYGIKMSLPPFFFSFLSLLTPPLFHSSPHSIPFPSPVTPPLFSRIISYIAVVITRVSLSLIPFLQYSISLQGPTTRCTVSSSPFFSSPLQRNQSMLDSSIEGQYLSYLKW